MKHPPTAPGWPIVWGICLLLFASGGCIIDDLDTGGLRCGADGGCTLGRSCFVVPDYGPHCLAESNGFKPYTPGAAVSPDVPKESPPKEPASSEPTAEPQACPSSCETSEDCADCPGRTHCSNFITFKACSVAESSCPTTCQNDDECASCTKDRIYCIDVGSGIKACAAGDTCKGTCTTNDDCKDCTSFGRPYCKPAYGSLNTICLP